MECENDERFNCIPEDVIKSANATTLIIIHEKSKDQYWKKDNDFIVFHRESFVRFILMQNPKCGKNAKFYNGHCTKIQKNVVCNSKYNTNADALSRIQIYPIEIDAKSTAVQPDDELEQLLNEIIEFENRELRTSEFLPTQNLNSPIKAQTPENLLTKFETVRSNSSHNSQIPGPSGTLRQISTSTSTSKTSRRENLPKAKTINICEDAIDRKERQIFIKTVFQNPQKPKATKENGMTIIKAQISQENNNEEIKNLLIESCEPKKHYYCFIDNEKMYKDVCRTFSKTFNDDATILKRCTKRITLVTNKDEQQDLIKNYHEGKTNHRGIRETYTRLQRLYYWSKLTLDVSDFINKCEFCKKTKYERHPPEIPLKVTPKLGCPFQQLNIDLFTIEGKTFLTLIDAFTKLSQAYPIRSKNAIDVSDTLIVYFSHYGIPEKITFDSGTEFQNDAVQKLLETHIIKIHFTTPRHPQSNGLIERFHSTITEHYRILKQNFNDPPDKTMTYAIIGYNNSIHSVTNLKPLQLLFGRTSTQNPFDLYHNYYFTLTNEKCNKVKPGDYICNLPQTTKTSQDAPCKIQLLKFTQKYQDCQIHIQINELQIRKVEKWKNQWIGIFPSEQPVTSICNQDEKSLSIKRSYVIVVPDGCKLQINSTTLQTYQNPDFPKIPIQLPKIEISEMDSRKENFRENLSNLKKST
ncbi:hypothetical protein TcasGA2_TC016117 [Tribolium castaneum]|uniref:RNA-directed DNA polymerase n=1 Tax=Tribolium castaneum TaxID=7070 RepID=D7EIR0_TRICA|nr:hypothetical protein TcasGA2_TC016117 [Tribolium castaneum]